MLASAAVRVSGGPGYQMFCVQLFEKNNADNVALNVLKLKSGRWTKLTQYTINGF